MIGDFRGDLSCVVRLIAVALCAELRDRHVETAELVARGKVADLTGWKKVIAQVSTDPAKEEIHDAVGNIVTGMVDLGLSQFGVLPCDNVTITVEDETHRIAVLTAHLRDRAKP